VRRVIDFLRRFSVYALTYLLGFIGALAYVAAATQVETTTWMPLTVGVLFYFALALLPQFKNIVLRLPVAGFFTSGALALWFMSEPAAASEPNERFSILIPILAALGPASCGLLVLLLWEERRAVSRTVWFWLVSLVAAGWFVSYFSSDHNLAGAVIKSHPSLRYSETFAQDHNLPHRAVFQALAACFISLLAVALAAASKAQKSKQWAFAFVVPIIYAAYDELRNTLEFTERISKRNVLLDASVILLSVVVAMSVFNFFAKQQKTERLPPNSGNNH
jgi:uncharacterized membrane protein YhaH (DUF805 family)